jgi:hypothetical protein
MNTQTYQAAVSAVLKIYLARANAEPLESAGRMSHVADLFAYLLTAEVRELFWVESFSQVRHIILKKIHEFKYNAYLLQNAQKYHRFIATMDDLFTYLVRDDKVVRRRSERLKHGAGLRSDPELQAAQKQVAAAKEAMRREVEVKRVEVKRVEVKRVEAKRVEVKRVEVKPVEVKEVQPLRRSVRLMQQAAVKEVQSPRRSVRLMQKK